MARVKATYDFMARFASMTDSATLIKTLTGVLKTIRRRDKAYQVCNRPDRDTDASNAKSYILKNAMLRKKKYFGEKCRIYK